MVEHNKGNETLEDRESGVEVLDGVEASEGRVDIPTCFEMSEEVRQGLEQSFDALDDAIATVENDIAREKLMSAAEDIKANALAELQATLSGIKTTNVEAGGEVSEPGIEDKGLADRKRSADIMMQNWGSGAESSDQDQAKDSQLTDGQKSADIMMKDWLSPREDSSTEMSNQDQVEDAPVSEPVSKIDRPGKALSQKEVLGRYFDKSESDKTSKQSEQSEQPVSKKKMTLKEFEKQAQRNVTANLRGEPQLKKKDTIYVESKAPDWAGLADQYKKANQEKPVAKKKDVKEPESAVQEPVAEEVTSDNSEVTPTEYERTTKQGIKVIEAKIVGKRLDRYKAKTTEEAPVNPEKEEGVESKDEFEQLLALEDELNNINDEGREKIIEVFGDKGDRRKVVSQLKRAESCMNSRIKHRKKLEEAQAIFKSVSKPAKEQEIALEKKIQKQRAGGDVDTGELKLASEKYGEIDRKLNKYRKPVSKAEAAVNDDLENLAGVEEFFIEMAVEKGIKTSGFAFAFREQVKQGEEIVNKWKEARLGLMMDIDQNKNMSSDEHRIKKSQSDRLSSLIDGAGDGSPLARARDIEKIWKNIDEGTESRRS